MKKSKKISASRIALNVIMIIISLGYVVPILLS